MELTAEQLRRLERIAQELDIPVSTLRVFVRISAPQTRRRFSAEAALRAFGKPALQRAD